MPKFLSALAGHVLGRDAGEVHCALHLPNAHYYLRTSMASLEVIDMNKSIMETINTNAPTLRQPRPTLWLTKTSKKAIGSTFTSTAKTTSTNKKQQQPMRRRAPAKHGAASAIDSPFVTTTFEAPLPVIIEIDETQQQQQEEMTLQDAQQQPQDDDESTLPCELAAIGQARFIDSDEDCSDAIELCSSPSSSSSVEHGTGDLLMLNHQQPYHSSLVTSDSLFDADADAALFGPSALPLAFDPNTSVEFPPEYNNDECDDNNNRMSDDEMMMSTDQEPILKYPEHASDGDFVHACRRWSDRMTTIRSEEETIKASMKRMRQERAALKRQCAALKQNILALESSMFRKSRERDQVMMEHTKALSARASHMQ